MKLKVIAGAKEGVEVPLKKNKLVIGRSSDCTLRASSDAISRHHCAVLRSETGEVTIRDLGSRNGTLVNGAKIERETPLVDGDEIQVGPLRFLAVLPAGLKSEKKPAVKSVAEAVERAASQSAGGVADDDDISRWLLGPEPTAEPASARETQTFRLDETQAVKSLPDSPPAAQPDAGGETISVEDLAADSESDDADSDEADGDDDKKSKKKRKPGKLPPLPTKPQAKDSREAAADILREMARRR